jgi:hypothetical protein
VKKIPARKVTSKYSARPLELAYEQYKLLREDEEYIIQFKRLQKLSKKCQSISNKEEKIKLLILLIDLTMNIKKEWDLLMPISPYLKLKRQDIYKSIRPNSSLAKFVYAFNIDSNPALVSRKIAKETVSKPKKELELRVKQYLCYSMHKVRGAKNRMIARRFGISKDTVANWIEKVDSWSEDERNAVVAEAQIAKAISDTDVLNLSKQRLVSLSKLEYGLTKDGFCDDGRKMKHKPTDKASDEQ